MNKQGKIIKARIVSLQTGKDTIKVRVERRARHSKYEKLIKQHTNYLVHVPESAKENYQIGDQVKIISTAPFSKKKTWSLIYKKSNKAKKK